MEIRFDPIITKELILQNISQEAIMEHYLGVHIGKGLFRSPLRNDKKPTCAFYKNRSGDLIFKDFGGYFYGNCFSVVMNKYNCSYHEALEIIANDFGIVKNNKLQRHEKLIDYSNKILEKSEPCILQAEIKEFSEKELAWWKSFGITSSTLKYYNVFSCKSIFLNSNYYGGSSDKNFIFGYYNGIDENDIEKWRFYFPFRSSYRFLSNWPKTMIQGYRQLPKQGDLLVITKSMKDVMCLYDLGITAIAPNSETLFISEEELENLSRRFKVISVLYDQDKAGKANMAKIRRSYPDLFYFVIPKNLDAKDISDFYKKYGRDRTLELINKGIQWLNTQQKTLLKNVS